LFLKEPGQKTKNKIFSTASKNRKQNQNPKLRNQALAAIAKHLGTHFKAL
jgi:hypothetical protein